MTFPHKIGVDRCVGSCNDVANPYYKVCLPDVVKNVSVKSFDLISRKSFHKSYKCGCLSDEKVCNNKQKWNEEKCRCECLEIKDCDIGFSCNVINCSCELRKKAAGLIVEECDSNFDKKSKRL